MGTNKGGRPQKYTKQRRREILAALEKYYAETDIPILAEFAYKHGITRQRLYEFPELSDTIKLAIEKKEAQLERLSLSGKIEKTMAIFSLKQLGWTDRAEVKHSTTLSFADELAEIHQQRTQRKPEAGGHDQA